MNRFLFKWRKIVNRLHLMLFVKQCENGRHVIVCHVLRYTVFYQKLKALLDGGTVGEIVSDRLTQDSIKSDVLNYGIKSACN